MPWERMHLEPTVFPGSGSGEHSAAKAATKGRKPYHAGTRRKQRFSLICLPKFQETATLVAQVNGPASIQNSELGH